MANISFYGNAGISLQPGEKTVYNRNGIAERTSVFMCQGYPSWVPIPLVTAYPNQSTGGFVCDKTEVVQEKGGFYKMTVVWVSIFAPNSSYVTYDSKLIQVPIDQSPNFTAIAGTPSSPLNGAQFDTTTGLFLGFGPGDYQGVVSAFIQQDLMIIRGSGTSAATPDPQYFCESISNTLRGAVWEYEIVYNLDIDIDTGIPDSSD